MTLNPEFKAKWVAALRSGEYKQGVCFLRNARNEFCCLGIAVELMGLNWQSNLGDCYGHENSDLLGTLTASERESIGLNDDAHMALFRMNDNGRSFSEIADWIEANL